MTAAAAALFAGLLAFGSSVDAPDTERIYVGHLDGRPCLRVREKVQPAPGGGRVVEVETVLNVERPARATLRQQATFVESSAGDLASFHIETTSGDERAVLDGVVEVDGTVKRIRGVVERNGERRQVARAVPADLPVLGPHGERRHLLRQREPGPMRDYASPAWLDGDLAIVTYHARRVDRSEARGRHAFEITSSGPSPPVRMTLDGTGHVLEAEWRMGRMAARLSPAAGLVGDAGLAATRLTVAHRGPPPLPTGENRLCLPPRLAPAAVEDDFQRRTADGLLVVGGDAQQPTSLMTRVRDAVALRVRPTTHGSLGTPRSALDTGAGDCTEAADVLARALAAQHLAARVEIGLMHDTTSGRWEGHAWTSAYDPVAARWVHLDPFYPDQSRSLYVKIGSGTSVADAIARSRLLDLLGSEPLEPIRAYRNSPVRSALATASDLECTSSFP